MTIPACIEAMAASTGLNGIAIIPPFKPMLAAKADLGELRFPLLVSPKFDGIRCCVVEGQVLTRKLKPVPNAFVQARLATLSAWYQLDGELMLRDPNSPTGYAGFNATSSAIMSKDGEPDFVYVVFDNMTGNEYSRGYCQRMTGLVGFAWDRVKVLWHTEVENMGALMELHRRWCSQGYEGSMLRDPHGAYKFGRSTVREGGLLKLKDFQDGEFVVTGAEERMHNANALETDNLGHAKRSSHKSGMVPTGTLGALVLRTGDGVEFRCGSGFTEEQRAAMWPVWRSLVGHMARVRFQELTPAGVPRFPVFDGFRSPLD